jgi:hypothetical protein
MFTNVYGLNNNGLKPSFLNELRRCIYNLRAPQYLLDYARQLQHLTRCCGNNDNKPKQKLHAAFNNLIYYMEGNTHGRTRGLTLLFQSFTGYFYQSTGSSSHPIYPTYLTNSYPLLCNTIQRSA